MAVKYVVILYIRIDPEDLEFFDTLSEALEAKRHLQALQPENHYEIEQVEV